MQLTTITSSGLTEADQSALNTLMRVWADKLTRNTKRLAYYDGKVFLTDLGISIPPRLRSVQTVCGWPAKAVDTLAARSRFDGYTFAADIETDLAALLRENDFKSVYDQALRSALIHSCSFLTVSAGAKGEPKVVLNAYSADSAAALWDVRCKRISYGMTIVESDPQSGAPTGINLYTPLEVIELVRDRGSDWRTNHV